MNCFLKIIPTYTALVKVPQIVKIFNEGSGAGVSVFSQLLELTAYTTSVMYSVTKKFHFSAWGESLFLSCQSLAIIGLILWFERNFRRLLFVLTCYFVVCALYLWDWFSDDLVTVFQTLSILLVLSARGLQALENYRNQSTGQLSAITFSLLLLGSVARIFTSVQETGDPVIIMQYAVSSVMNAIICWQIYAYWGRRMPLKKTE
ncbi:Mannose-P-dolichol utilization defect 1 protein [Trichuris trichiura]|uniref:Mannose-P-dolichol utilization defect 1 protein homolog n=1 Tax=Trichuris trichiura TaxID=36087 RepID=A0A077Z2H6_TRITR|nr:Mannose-P-dolichol utilization defect 1 protein [Trichuris trichiura]